MTVTANVRVTDLTERLFDAMRAKTISGLEAAENVGKTVFDQRASGITETNTTGVHTTGTGYASGIRARNAIYRVFDKGSLGKRKVKLKRPNLRKSTWQVRQQRRGYTAHRSDDLAGKGISPRDITNPARAAGKHALEQAIRR